MALMTLPGKSNGTLKTHKVLNINMRFKLLIDWSFGVADFISLLPTSALLAPHTSSIPRGFGMKTRDQPYSAAYRDGVALVPSFLSLAPVLLNRQILTVGPDSSISRLD